MRADLESDLTSGSITEEDFRCVQHIAGRQKAGLCEKAALRPSGVLLVDIPNISSL